ncbi:NAD(P)H-dependent FMN reductase LOT6 [Hyphodiscus hymeniophilus]|uniref:NAD(P)H-dependent FMN reductase LOT6 n=1 Tax=Hyphodiscus hymeniophilus TaxID=353542 RepID=A0A9P6SPX8_9HELO|nr:NAD(P)H-dependent FMN reductase LOT6 [Hyphodiscus hymeniophilus]
MTTTIPKKVALVLASTRAVRAGPDVVDWVKKTLLASPASPKPEISIVDVKTFNLPVFNESIMPAMVPAYGQFEHAEIKAWSAAIEAFDAYIWVSPEYNFGVPGAVKNAIDSLYNEWIGKPVLVVTYGIFGGASASESLQKTLNGMKLRVAETRPKLEFSGWPDKSEMMSAAGGKIGPKTLEHWEAESKETLLKGFGELIELLETPASAEKTA